MAILHVQGIANFTSGGQTTITATFGAAITSGNAVVGAVHFDDNNTTINSIADDKGNNYSFKSTAGAGTQTDNVKEASGNFGVTANFVLGNITNAPTVITVTFSSTSGGPHIVADEFSGIFANTAPVEAHAGQVQTAPGTGTDALTSGPITPATNGDLIYGVTVENEDSTLSSSGTGFTSTGLDTGPGTHRLTSEWLVQGSAGSIAATFTSATGTNSSTLVMALKAAGAAVLIVGWQNNAADVYGASPQKFSAAPAFVSSFRTTAISGMAWQEPLDRIKLPPRAAFSEAPAFISPFRTAGIAGISWSGPRDDPGLKRVSFDSAPAFGRSVTMPVPISGMAWDTLHENDILPKGRFLTDPVAVTYIPQTVTWAFLVGDTIFLRDAPLDSAPGFGQSIVQIASVGISGMAWFAPPDRDRPAVRINIEALPAISLTPATLPVPIRGMAWFMPKPDSVRVAVSFSDAPALQQAIIQLAPSAPAEFHNHPFIATMGQMMTI